MSFQLKQYYFYILLLAVFMMIHYLIFNYLTISSKIYVKEESTNDVQIRRLKRQDGEMWWIEPNIKCSDFIYTKSNQSEAAAAAAADIDFKNLPLEIIAQMDEEAKLEANFQIEDVYREDNEMCSNYLQRRHFVQQSQSKEEADFPIAYSLLVFKDYAQVEFLLRTIYRPEHCICIHIDVKANKKFVKAMNNLIECFPQDSVFIAPESMNVKWARISLLDAELVCMKYLWSLINKKKWKYFINLAGQEFPLKTNLELVKILKSFNHSNMMEGTRKGIAEKRIPKTTMPFPVRWTKGNLHVTVIPEFVDFALHSSEAQVILGALRKSGVPFSDETFFSTLNHNPHLKTPGAYLLYPETHPTNYPFINRFVNWYRRWPCRSNNSVRGICVWGLLDLSLLVSRQELFVNKFYWHFQNVASKCMQEWYWNRTRKELETGKVDLDLTYYENLSFVKHHQ